MIRKWILLAAAIVCEVTATLALRAALDHSAWYTVVTTGYIGAFVALGFTLRSGMGIGVAYGIWGASGVALTAVLATAIFGDPLTGLMGLGIAFVIAGVLCVEFGAQKARLTHDGATA